MSQRNWGDTVKRQLRNKRVRSGTHKGQRTKEKTPEVAPTSPPGQPEDNPSKSSSPSSTSTKPTVPTPAVPTIPRSAVPTAPSHNETKPEQAQKPPTSKAPDAAAKVVLPETPDLPPEDPAPYKNSEESMTDQGKPPGRAPTRGMKVIEFEEGHSFQREFTAAEWLGLHMDPPQPPVERIYGGPRFIFTPEGAEAPPFSISVDGIVPGTALHLSHWRDNETPPEFKADTSTEIVLKFIQSEESKRWRSCPITNNHFDTDGVLSAWTLLEPDRALARKDLLIAAAIAGDFGEWPALDAGLWLNHAIQRIGDEAPDDDAAYQEAFRQLPDLLANIESRTELWADLKASIDEGRKAVNDGSVSVHRMSKLGIVVRKLGAPPLPRCLIHQLLKDCWRYLMASEEADGKWSYLYCLPFHAWAETVDRPTIPVPSPRTLNASLGEGWTSEGFTELTAVLGTSKPIGVDPKTVSEILVNCDEDLRVGNSQHLNRY